MSECETLHSALTKSLTMEKRGYEFYKKASRKCTSKFGKKVFDSLAKDERYHVEAITKFFLTFTESNKTPAAEAVFTKTRDEDNLIVFGKSAIKLLEGISDDSDEFKAYEFAMKFEKEGYDYYKKVFDSVSDVNARALYEFLLGEEKRHYDLISNTYRYLKDPGAWFAEEEKPIVEG